MKYDAADFVFPIFQAIIQNGENPKMGEFLGTAFAAGQPNLIITAKHVAKSWDKDYLLISQATEDREIILFSAELIYCHPKVDLALLKTHGYKCPVYATTIAKENQVYNDDPVYCFEFSTFKIRQAPDEHGRLRKAASLNPAIRMGNITRFLTNFELESFRQFEITGEKGLELSFPVFAGASGSPIVHTNESDSSFSLVGVAVGNTDYQLDMHGSTMENPKTIIVPQGLGIHVKHVHDLLACAM